MKTLDNSDSYMKNFVVEGSSHQSGGSSLSNSMGLCPLISLNFKCIGYTAPKISTSWSKNEPFSTVNTNQTLNFSFNAGND